MKRRKKNSRFEIFANHDLCRFMFDNIRTEIMVIRSDGIIVYANKPAVKSLGASPKDIIGKPITQFMQQKISLEAWKKEYFRKLKKSRKPTKYILHRNSKKSGNQIIEILARYFKECEGEYILSSSSNVTNKKTLEDKLQESQDLFRLFTDQVADAVFTVNMNGEIIYANKASEKITKVPLSKAKEHSFLQFVSDKFKPKARNVFKRVKKGEAVILGEMEIMDKNKNVIPVEFTSTPITRGGKIIQIHTIFRDIRKKKQLQRLIRESEKSKAVEQFITGTSQEIQGPLTGVYENTDNLIHKYKDRDYEYIGFKEFKDIIKTLETMRDQLKYCCDTSNRLLKISKKSIGMKTNYCDFRRIVKDVVKNLQYSFEISDIKMELKIPRKLPPAAIGGVELRQVLNNALTNSIQSIPGGGLIRINVNYMHDEDMIRLIVGDNGEGISQDMISRVFDPFFTTKSRGLEKSSGLGLSIVHSIINSVKGDISIDSSLKKGTKLHIKIPIYKNGYSK